MTKSEGELCREAFEVLAERIGLCLARNEEDNDPSCYTDKATQRLWLFFCEGAAWQQARTQHLDNISPGLLYVAERIRDKFNMSGTSDGISLRWEDLARVAIDQIMHDKSMGSPTRYTDGTISREYEEQPDNQPAVSLEKCAQDMCAAEHKTDGLEQEAWAQWHSHYKMLTDAVLDSLKAQGVEIRYED